MDALGIYYIPHVFFKIVFFLCPVETVSFMYHYDLVVYHCYTFYLIVRKFLYIPQYSPASLLQVALRFVYPAHLLLNPHLPVSISIRVFIKFILSRPFYLLSSLSLTYRASVRIPFHCLSILQLCL